MHISTPTTPSLSSSSSSSSSLSLSAMDALEDHRNLIAKRKRTKRQRPQSPIPISISANCNDDDDFNSPTMEEEETANCLILLAQGIQIYHDHNGTESKFTTKQISEAGNGVTTYGCKTCNRAFPSFQALGGHMASHKKSMNRQQLSSDEDKEDQQLKAPVSSPVSTPPQQTMEESKILPGNSNGSSRIHECSICGAEFASGQALGGHMRRHRTSENRCEAKIRLDLNFPAPASDHERETKFGFGTTEKMTQKQDRSGLLLSTAPALVVSYY